MNEILAFSLLGLGVGALGTLIGAGGGFVLMPILMFLKPGETPEHLTSVSLSVALANAVSGSLIYARMGRIDFRTARIFIVACLPGVVLGTALIRIMPRSVFDPIFAAILAAMGIHLLISKGLEERRIRALGRFGEFAVGAGASTIASVFGVGGGVLLVPALVRWFGFPVLRATATSQLIIVGMTSFASLIHGVGGGFPADFKVYLPLFPTVILGSQLGANLSQKIKGHRILQILGIALLICAFRILF